MTDGGTPGRLVIPPGIPDDDNRDHLPAHLHGSSIVVNENGNNSQPYPHRLQDLSEVLPDQDLKGVVFVPRSVDPAHSVPLVVSLHGGLMAGWGQAVYSSWTLIAEREGFVVAFPDAAANGIWSLEGLPVQPGWIPGNPTSSTPSAGDVDSGRLLRLLEALSTRLPIDRERIFLHGMSMGNAMADQFARTHGHLLAGLAGSGGPSNPSHLTRAEESAALPTWQTHLEIDDVPAFFGASREDTLRDNIAFRRRANRLGADPVISVRGRDSFIIWSGGDADLVFHDVADRDHGQTFDQAELVWSGLFSGCRRRGAVVERDARADDLRGDSVNVVVADGCTHAIVDNVVVPLRGRARTWRSVKYHGLAGDTRVRSEHVMVPSAFLGEHFARARTTNEDGSAGELKLLDGRVVRFARGSVGAVIDEHLTAMPVEALHREGDLYLPLEWFAEAVLQLRASHADGVVYVTDHWSRLSSNAARVIADLLNGRGRDSDAG